MYSVYKHTNKENGKVYIGMTCNSWQKRWGSKYPNNPHLHEAINKYGNNGFTHEVIADNLTKEEAEFLERKLIQDYDSTNQQKGYNIERGGNHIGKHSEQTKAKISESQKGRIFTEEHKKHLSESHKGHKISKETKEKYRNRMLGNTYTLGFRHSEETKKKMSESHKGKGGKQVICLNDGKIYKTINEAAEHYGLNRHKVLNNCTGKTRQIRNSNLQFEYYERK